MLTCGRRGGRFPVPVLPPMLHFTRKEPPIAATDITRQNGNQQEDAPAGPMVVKNQRLQKFRNTTDTLDIRREAGEFAEIGTTGLRQYGGFVLEEWLQGLQGRKAAWAYREMMDNDPVVGAILFAIEQLARGVQWRTTGGDAQRAEFVEENMHDMSHTWLDFVSEALSMLPYGWSFHEEVLKRRKGKVEVPDTFFSDWLRSPQSALRNLQDRGRYSGLTGNETMENTAWVPASSEFSDGKIGWRKLPVRAQETLLRWWFDGYSTPVAMEQIDWHGGAHVIPMDKALLFRTKTTRDNPEGRSILRNAWTSFFKMSNIQQIEAIGIERDLAGIPQLSPPEGVDLNAPGQEAIRQRAEELVQAVRKDEDEGILFPTAGWLFELTTTGGARAIDTDQVIRRYESRIASSVLADFVLLGQDAIGSYAMVDIKSELFGTAIDTILDVICSVMNEQAIPRLLAVNGMKTEDPPKITHSSAGRLDLERVGRFFQSLALAGGPIPWSKELIEELFKEAGLPANFEGSVLETTEHPTGGVNSIPSGPLGNQERQNGSRATGPRADARERTTSTTPVVKTDDTMAMVALYPAKQEAKAIAQKGGLKAKDLHLTLGVIGAPAASLDSEAVEQIEAVVAGFAARTRRLEGEIGGWGQFTEGDEDVTWAAVDVPILTKVRETLVADLRHSHHDIDRTHGYTPHITLAYKKIKPKFPPTALHFTTVSLVIGGRRKDYPLTGLTAIKSDSDEQEEHSPAKALGRRAHLLAGQLQIEVHQALSELGQDAATAYSHEAVKAKKPTKSVINRIVRRVLERMNTEGWVDQRLGPILANHAARVAGDTQRTLQTETRLEMELDDEIVKALMASAGSQLKLSDIVPQVRVALALAIEQGYERGENPIVIARRIRDAVPDGAFTKAGSKYRAELIARNETANLQRKASLALYKSSPRIPEIILRDGIYGPPRSDPQCIARDGQRVKIEDVDSVQPYHPLCTLGFDPVISARG